MHQSSRCEDGFRSNVRCFRIVLSVHGVLLQHLGQQMATRSGRHVVHDTRCFALPDSAASSNRSLEECSELELKAIEAETLRFRILAVEPL